MGASTRWMLSHALFSSNKIDDGSHLLLKTIAKRISIDSCESLLDIGCGIGIIAGALNSRFPKLKVHLCDRDALALAAAADNFSINKLPTPVLSGELALENIDSKYDLIVSNIPAKIGTPVLRDLIYRLPSYVHEDGTAAIVVISSLREAVESALAESDGRIQFTEHTPNYSVFHIAGTAAAASDFDFSQYIRGEQRFSYKKRNYTLKTVYNLPDFDMLSYRDICLYNCLDRHTVKGRLAVYNPGQGHLPVFLLNHRSIKEVHIYSRDILQLNITEKNVRDAGVKTYSNHVPFPGAVEALKSPQAAHTAIYTNKVPGISPGRYWAAAKHLAADGQTVSFTGQSSEIHLLTKDAPIFFRIIDSVKYRGFRTVLYQKQ